MGCTLLGISFTPLIFIAHGLRADQRVNLLWLVSCAFIYTLGELYLAPVGYSLVSKVAPPRLVSMLMGAWFLANFAGNYLAGYLGTFYERMSREAFFSVLMVLGLAASAAILTLSVPLRRAVGRNM
jgi:proton-dependent oligopeptide transporter, POT family